MSIYHDVISTYYDVILSAPGRALDKTGININSLHPG